MRGGQELLYSSCIALCTVVGQSVEMKAEALRPSNKSLPEDWIALLGFPCQFYYFELLLYSVWERVIKGTLVISQKG